MSKVFSCLILSIFLLFGCRDNPSESKIESPFSLEVTVIDPNGNALPNINVGIWSMINSQNTLQKVNSESEINSETSIHYSIIKLSFVEIIVYDLENKMIEQIVSRQHEPGNYRTTWYHPNSNTAFKCKLIASSDSLQKNILFSDSIYITQICSDPNVSTIGKSDDNGIVKTTNKLMFPHLYHLPPVPYTSAANPDVLGYFRYSDSVNITLSNGSFQKMIFFKKGILNGENKFRLTWDQTLMKQTGEDTHINSPTPPKNTKSIGSAIFMSFSANIKWGAIILDWKTSEEKNSKGFEVQRTNNSTEWKSIAFLNGKGTTAIENSYRYVEPVLPYGIWKYRLKIIDFDESYSFSNEVVVEVTSPTEWKLSQNYPNPFY